MVVRRNSVVVLIAGAGGTAGCLKLVVVKKRGAFAEIVMSRVDLEALLRRFAHFTHNWATVTHSEAHQSSSKSTNSSRIPTGAEYSLMISSLTVVLL